MASGDIIIRWVSESAAAIRDMNRVNTALGKTSTSADRWSRRMNTATNVAFGGLALAVPVAYKMVSAASDQEQAIGSLTAVYKDYSDEMIAASENSNRLGLSQTQYAQFATLLGAQLKNLGFDTEDASVKTQELIDMAADMSAQFGGPTTDAVEALSGVLRGEFDSVEKYGVSLSKTKIEAYATANNLTYAEAALILVNKQLKKTDTIGAAKREYKTFAAQVGRLQGAWADFTAEIGSGGTKDSASLIEQLTKALRGVTRWVKQNPDTFQKIIKGVTGLAAALVTLKVALAVIGPLGKLLGLIKRFPKASGIVGLTALIVALYEALKDVDAGASGALGSLRRFWDIKAPFSGGWWVTNLIDNLNSKLKTAYDWLNDVATAIDNVLGFRANKLFPSLNIPGIGGPGLLPGAPSLSVGRISRTTTAVPAVSVYVAGQRQRSRTVIEPQWAPSTALGMI